MLWKSPAALISKGPSEIALRASEDVLCLPLRKMTQEEIQEIRSRWLAVKFRQSLDATASDPGLAAAASDIWRLLGELSRLQHSCDELTRQYARLLRQVENQGIDLSSDSIAAR